MHALLYSAWRSIEFRLSRHTVLLSKQFRSTMHYLPL